MISVYTSAFNILANKFPYETYLKYAIQFADEVVIAVNKSTDNTIDVLRQSNCKIVECDIPYDDPLLDGKIKNIALQNTTQPIKVQLDLDEYIPTSQRMLWRILGEQLLNDHNVSALFLPVIDLYKDMDHCKSINAKWYMHKAGLFRGPVNFGKLNNGHVDINKSDTCELIDQNGNLIPAISLMRNGTIAEKLFYIKSQNLPFVIHTGYLDLTTRILRNHQFWKQHWSIEAGQPVDNVPMSIEEINDEIYVEHGLNII